MPERDPDGGESLLASLRRVHGPDVDPGVSLSDTSAAASAPRPDGPAGPASSLSPLLARVGSRPGGGARYTQDGEIARGGMGAILAVWDEDLRRRLAMKVALGRDGAGSSRPDQLDPRVLARFLEEAQVTGQLEHPGIVPVHELGLDDEGRLYFTMRLVRGNDLEHVLELVDGEREGWSRTRALGVLLKACEALAFAHDKGVIHRDLKPANVMVGPFGEVYVMDWGLARVRGLEDRHDVRPEARREGPVATDQSADRTSGELRTMDGDVIGTPAYMPPEQARGDLSQLDARADVYAMGAMLYRLLAGAAPFMRAGEPAAPLEVLQRLLDGPPEPLAALAPEAPPALVAIAEKAMAREPAGRYADMVELAEDLRSFLEGRVVQAYETGALAEARMWVRRNKALAGSLAGAVAALVVGLVSSLVLTARADASALLAESRRVQAEDATRVAEEQRAEAGRLATLAEERRAEAETAAAQAEESAREARRQAAIAREVNRFLNDDILAAARPDELGFDVTMRRALEVAQERIDGRTWSDPAVEAEVLFTIGGTFVQLSLPERAVPLFTRALELYRAELGERSEEALKAMGAVAAALRGTDRHREALELSERLVELYREETGPLSAASVGTRMDMARTLVDLGELARARGVLEAVIAETEEHYARHADGDLNWILGADSPPPESAQGVRALLPLAQVREGERLAGAHVGARGRLAHVLRELGELAASEGHSRFVLEVLESRLDPAHTEIATAANELALCLSEQARYDEAEALLERVLASNRRSKGPEHDDTLVAMLNVADLYSKRGRLRESEDLLEEVVQVYGRTRPEDDASAIRARRNLAAAYAERGRTARALEVLEPAVASYERVLGARHPETLMVLNNLANLYRESGRLDEAEEILRAVLEGFEATLGRAHPDRLLVLENLGNVLYTRGELEGVVGILEEVLEGRRSAFGPDHPDVAKTCLNLGLVLSSLGRSLAARGVLEDGLRSAEISVGDRHPTTARLLNQVGDARLAEGEHRAAAEAYGRAAAALDALEGEAQSAGYARHQLAWALLQLEDWERALPAARAAHAFRVELHGPAHPYTLASHYLRVAVEARAGELEAAEAIGLELHRLATEAGNDTALANAARALHEVYVRMGRPEEAARW